MDFPSPSAPTVDPARCWCGTLLQEVFSDDYWRCPTCVTLVARVMPGEGISRVEDDERDFYGKNYYLHHVQETNGLPDLTTRARADLPERCLHWLRTFLRFVPHPGARVLEVGCGHGGFVAMLRWAGFDATGLELSPWLTERVREWFDVPVLTGRLEDQELPDGSLDAVVLMDVLEHLPDPRGTMARAARLLRPGGFLLVQTPAYPAALPDVTALRAAGHPFAQMLLPAEHLHLFSVGAAARLMGNIGLPETRFEPAIFGQYDMFFVASAGPLPERPETDWPTLLTTDPAAAPAGRAVLALLDLGEERRSLVEQLARAETDANERQNQVARLTALLKESEADAAARLQRVEALGRELARVGAESAARGEQTRELERLRKESEADRAARGQQIETLGQDLARAQADAEARLQQVELLTTERHEVEADRAARNAQIEELTALLRESEADRAARGQQIAQLTEWLKESETDRAARGEQITTLTALCRAAQAGAAVPTAVSRG